ncbi:MAG: restriction endonuclease [Polyangiaceae bacterium]
MQERKACPPPSTEFFYGLVGHTHRGTLALSSRLAARCNRRAFTLTSWQNPTVEKWQDFEHLVATIHQLLNATDYSVETDVVLTEPSGAKHQIDVVLQPKTPFAGPILVSCKAWREPVGVDHVREWSDIVQHTGAAAGVIVALSGFTGGAIDASRNKERRISLWKPRPLTTDDFAPDGDSPDGYLAHICIQGQLRAPRIVEKTFRLEAPRADGKPATRQTSFNFSLASRDQWYLRDTQDNVVDNLWDQVVALAQSAQASGNVEIVPDEPRFFVLQGVRLQLRRVSFDVEVIVHELNGEVNLFKDAFGYVNAITEELKIVPLPMFASIEQQRNARKLLDENRGV